MAKIKMKCHEAVQALMAFNSVEGKCDIAMSWAIADIKEALAKNSKRFDDEKMKLLTTYGEEMDIGIPGRKDFKLKKENISEYNSKMNELADTIVTIECDTLDYDQFAGQGLRLEAGLSQILRPFIIKAKLKEKIKKDNLAKRAKETVPTPQE